MKIYLHVLDIALQFPCSSPEDDDSCHPFFLKPGPSTERSCSPTHLCLNSYGLSSMLCFTSCFPAFKPNLPVSVILSILRVFDTNLGPLPQIYKLTTPLGLRLTAFWRCLVSVPNSNYLLVILILLY